MLRANATVAYVANHFGVSRVCINKLRYRLQATGSVNDRPRSGRPRVTTAAEDRHIRTMHLRNRFKTASETSREFRVARRVSRDTVLRRLRTAGIFARRPVQRILLRPRHCLARLKWAQLHQRWTLRRWKDVVFSDESRIQLETHDGRRRVFRRAHERFAPNCVSAVGDRRGVMVWGAISSMDRSPLIFINSNLIALRCTKTFQHGL